MEKMFTGHIYFGSAYETSNICGNCNGADCNSCREVYRVNDKQFDSPIEAQLYEKQLESDISSLLVQIEGNVYSPEMPQENDFFVKDGILYVSRFKTSDSVDEQWGDIDIACNQQSPAYNKMLEKATERMQKYVCCKCIDKEHDIERPCAKFGCTDSDCYLEMLRGRKEKKWYL